MSDYIMWLRQRVGLAMIQLNFAAACICDRDHVLLQRRGDQDGWGFPGGSMELGESAEQTVIREVQEETGLVINVDSLLGIYTQYQHIYPNGDIAQPITAFFYCTTVGGQLYADGEETRELRYFAFDDAPRLFTQQHRDAFEDMVAGRQGIYR